MKYNKVRIKLVFYRTLFSQSAASLTMGSVAAFLRQVGFICDLCLLDRQGLHNAEKILDGNERKIIIAKPNFKDQAVLLPLLAELKRQKTVEQVFFCGPYACLNYQSLMSKLPWLDGILFGDAEETALDLTKLMGAGKKPSDKNCPGGIWRKSTGKGFFPFRPRPRRLGLDNLPFPARDIERLEKGGYINIEASRGCHGGCSFCHVPLVSRISGYQGIDYRSPRLVVEEIALVHRTLGKKLFIFNDSCFWRGPADNARILQFCREIKKRKLAIKFYVYLKSRPELPEKIIRALRRAGLVRVFLGIENIFARSQNILNKKVARDAYELAKKRFARYDINIHIGYIIAEPYSKLSAVAENLKYLRKISKLFRLGTVLEPVRVVAGSALHKRLVKDGLLNADADFSQITHGYEYQDRKTARFMKGLRETFQEIKDEAYEFEYYCTTVSLLKSLLRQTGPKKFTSLAKDFLILEKLADNGMDDLLDFFLGLINLISRGRDNAKAVNLLRENFLPEFKKDCLAVKVKQADIINKTRLIGAGEAVDCLYSGQDRIS